jgi:hypothetical protein
MKEAANWATSMRFAALFLLPLRIVAKRLGATSSRMAKRAQMKWIAGPSHPNVDWPVTLGSSAKCTPL